MRELKISSQEKRALAIATMIAILFGAYFLSTFFTLVVLAGILAYLFNPLYLRLSKKMHHSSASAIVLLLSILAVVGPLILVVIFAGVQVSDNINSLANSLNGSSLTSIGNKVIELVNHFLDSVPFVNYSVTQQSLVDNAKNVSQAAGSYLLGIASGVATSLFGFITASIIYIYVFLSLLRNAKTLITVFRKLNPLGEEISDLYLDKIGAMVRGTVQGQFIIAVVQGFIGALTFAILGYPEYFFILFLVFSALSVIPLGAGILSIPLAVVMALFGQVWQAIVIILQHVLINSNIDNILRPILVPKKARLDAALMLLSVFAGIRLFGFLGIVIGPTIMILIVTTIRVYLDIFEDYGNSLDLVEKPRKSKLWFLTRKRKA